MSRKKKVSKGNPAKVTEPKTKGWTPAGSPTTLISSPKNDSVVIAKPKPFVVAVTLLIVFVMVLTVIGSMLALTPSMQTPSDVPYQVPESSSSTVIAPHSI